MAPKSRRSMCTGILLVVAFGCLVGLVAPVLAAASTDVKPAPLTIDQPARLVEGATAVRVPLNFANIDSPTRSVEQTTTTTTSTTTTTLVPPVGELDNGTPVAVGLPPVPPVATSKETAP